MNPFDWSGTQFLQLYIPLAVFALVVAFAWRDLLRVRSAREKLPELHPYELAHLVGGSARTIDTALAHLVESEVLEFQMDSSFSRKNDLERHAHPLEKALVGACSTPQKITALRPIAAHEVGRIRDRLQRLGLEMTDREALPLRWLPVIPLALVLVLGLIKLAVGLEREKSVGFLVGGSIALVVLNIVVATLRTPLTTLGDTALADARAKHAALEVAAARAPATLAGHDLTLAVCLFGPMVLTGGLMPLQQVMHGHVTPGSTAYGNGCGSSCGSSGSGCGGGGGDGGGGGGGGGCGGCGGGD